MMDTTPTIPAYALERTEEAPRRVQWMIIDDKGLGRSGSIEAAVEWRQVELCRGVVH